MPTIDEVYLELSQKERSLAALRKEYEALGDRVYAAAVEYETLQDAYHRRKVEEAQAQGDTLDWPYLLAEGHGVEHYRTCQQALRDLGLDSSGYHLATHQRCVQIRLVRNKPAQVAQVAKSLAILLPHLTPVVEDWCRVSIADHRLSETGSYALWLKKDGTAARCVHTRYARESILMESADLVEVLRYIQANHYAE